MICTACPRECGIDREHIKGSCGVKAESRITRAALHMWEEPCISGTRGSGTIFFSGCNLQCVFCQNAAISRDGDLGVAVTEQGLADTMLHLESLGAHNINLVTPVPHYNVIASAIVLAKDKGLSIPIVYNTNAYEKAESLKMFDGLVDIYLPDLKYVSPKLSSMFSGASDYFEYASSAIDEMYRQCGNICLDTDGIANRGVLIRHLILPCCVDEARRVMNYVVSRYTNKAYFSLMSQYYPCGRALEMKYINRKLTSRERNQAIEHAESLRLENVYLQGLTSADCAFTPNFDNYFQ